MDLYVGHVLARSGWQRLRTFRQWQYSYFVRYNVNKSRRSRIDTMHIYCARYLAKQKMLDVWTEAVRRCRCSLTIRCCISFGVFFLLGFVTAYSTTSNCILPAEFISVSKISCRVSRIISRNLSCSISVSPIKPIAKSGRILGAVCQNYNANVRQKIVNRIYRVLNMFTERTYRCYVKLWDFEQSLHYSQTSSNCQRYILQKGTKFCVSICVQTPGWPKNQATTESPINRTRSY